MNNKKNILVIDNEECIRDTFAAFLLEEGYGVSTAESYDEFLLAIEGNTFDLLITVIILGGKTGLDIVHMTKEKGMNCSVIVITGFPSLEYTRETTKLGVSSFLMKPVDRESLLSAVTKALHPEE